MQLWKEKWKKRRLKYVMLGKITSLMLTWINFHFIFTLAPSPFVSRLLWHLAWVHYMALKVGIKSLFLEIIWVHHMASKVGITPKGFTSNNDETSPTCVENGKLPLWLNDTQEGSTVAKRHYDWGLMSVVRYLGELGMNSGRGELWVN